MVWANPMMPSFCAAVKPATLGSAFSTVLACAIVL
jgi:hypothetical protein